MILFPLLIASLLSFGNSQMLLNEGLIKDNQYLEFVSKDDGTYIINSLTQNDLTEYRLYSKYKVNNQTYQISEINDDLFLNIENDISVMISKDITTYSASLFSNEKITSILYTGSKEEWDEKGISIDKDITYYAYDEGFINYWNEKVRRTADDDICLMSKDEYLKLKNMYDALNAEDKTVVNTYKDKANQTIEDTMDYLGKFFAEESTNNNTKKQNLPQDMTLGIIVSIAIFGMTTISIFYTLKKQGIIN